MTRVLLLSSNFLKDPLPSKSAVAGVLGVFGVPGVLGVALWDEPRDIPVIVDEDDSLVAKATASDTLKLGPKKVFSELLSLGEGPSVTISRLPAEAVDSGVKQSSCEGEDDSVDTVDNFGT